MCGVTYALHAEDKSFTSRHPKSQDQLEKYDTSEAQFWVPKKQRILASPSFSSTVALGMLVLHEMNHIDSKVSLHCPPPHCLEEKRKTTCVCHGMPYAVVLSLE
jgi:hypothetical protein